MNKNQKLCIKCKTKPIWKGDKYHKNFWGLYCEECEEENQKEINRLVKQSVIDNTEGIK